MGMRTSPAGKSFTASFEGIILYAYPDPGYGWKVPTIGIGHTPAAGGYAPRRGDVISLERALALFEERIPRYESEVDAAITRGKTQPVFDAFTDMHFNTGAIRSGSVDEKWNRGDVDGALGVLSQYVNSGGKRLAGLVTRRAAEVDLIRHGRYGSRSVLIRDRPGGAGRAVPASSLAWGRPAVPPVLVPFPAAPVPVPVKRPPRENFLVDAFNAILKWWST